MAFSAASPSRPGPGAIAAAGTGPGGEPPVCYIAPSTALTSSSTAAVESYSPLKWAVTTS